MNMKIFRFLLVALTVTVLAAAAFAADSSRFLMPSPPDSALKVERDGTLYYGGMVYLPSHADTAMLSVLGFREFEFQGRVPGSVRYHALWPKRALADSLPGSISIEYEMMPPAPPDQDNDLSPGSGTPKPEGNR
jgi:hypothetical protein